MAQLCGSRSQGALRVIAVVACVLFGPPAAGAPYYNYPGAIHIHTVYSDGSGTFQEVAETAKATQLAYIITTDHNTLEPIRDGHQRYWGRVLVLVGTEISTDAGHYLALDLPGSFEWGTRDAQQVIDRVNAAGGFGVLAHPVSERWPWTDWSVTSIAGLEIINLASLMDADLRAVTQMNLPGRSLRRLAGLAQRYLTNPDAVMASFANNTVDRERTQWDALLREGRQYIGTAGVDAHARIPVAGTVYRVPTYREAFETVQTYAVALEPLRGDAESDRREIYRAYRNGRLYMVYPRVAPAPEFRFVAEEAGRVATMGQPITLAERVRLTVEAPDHSHPIIRLLRNGTEVASAEEARLEWDATQPGVYRVEVYAGVGAGRLFDIRRGLRLPRVEELLRSRRQELQPWIMSNPIYVRGTGTSAQGEDPVFPAIGTVRRASRIDPHYAALEAAGICCCMLP
ncbi:MAG: CehA/McbA family metallohydrolase [Armatimonadetes bacterium]|nr:CehA/McbA family metallohydrolase [Armatimonadota bacterium]